MLNLIATRSADWFRERILSDKLLRGFGALGLGELCVRVSRIVTTIILARLLDAAELGVAASALACFELVRVLANNGLGQVVIRAQEQDLAKVCSTVYRLCWYACILMASIQIASGLGIAEYTGRPELAPMILCLAGVYIFLPFGMMNSWLLQRQFRMANIAAISTAQVVTDNLLTAVLAICGLGAWAIVLPKLLTAPIWLAGVRRAVKWKRDRNAGSVPFAEIAAYAGSILVSEILVAVRLNVDKMLVGAIIGIEALGVYYFAFGAGYGLSLVLTSALAAASFPHLADHRLTGQQLLQRFDNALLRLALPIAGLIGLQSIAVFYYVPMLFGQKWSSMTAVVAVLCLSATTKSWYDLSAQLLRAAGLPAYELLASAIFTVVLLGAFGIGLTQGLLIGVTMLSVTTISLQLVFTVWARRIVAARLSRNGLDAKLSDRSSPVSSG